MHQQFGNLSKDIEVWSENSSMPRFTPMVDLFAPDLILPEEYEHLRERALPQRGEIRLLYAVLQDAIEYFQKSVGAEGSPVKVGAITFAQRGCEPWTRAFAACHSVGGGVVSWGPVWIWCTSWC